MQNFSTFETSTHIPAHTRRHYRWRTQEQLANKPFNELHLFSSLIVEKQKTKW